jgi:hypothetical protein
MPGLIFLAVISSLIWVGSFLSGFGIRTENAIHQIYGALLTVTSMLGFLSMTAAIGAAVVLTAIRNAQASATAENAKLLEGLFMVESRGRQPAGGNGSTHKQEAPLSGALV